MKSRGKWAGYPATELAPFMGCSVSQTKRLLSRLKKELARDLTVDDLAHLIVFQRNKAGIDKQVEDFLTRWIGPI